MLARRVLCIWTQFQSIRLRLPAVDWGSIKKREELVHWRLDNRHGSVRTLRVCSARLRFRPPFETAVVGGPIFSLVIFSLAILPLAILGPQPRDKRGD